MKKRLHRSLIMLAIVPALFFACSKNQESTSALTVQQQTSKGVSVVIGPTAIPRGNASGATDITVSNEFFAIAFAVETASPWGVARGGILDVAIMQDGKPAADFVSLVDFMPNYWSAWPTTYQQVEIEKNTAEHVVIRTRRDWGEVELETRYEVSAGSKLLRLSTRMTNAGSKTLAELQTGYIAWPDGGQLFGMPGLTEGDAVPVSESTAQAKWSASYDEGWALGLHTPYSELVAYTGRDRYLRHTLAPGATQVFEAWLQIEDRADLARMVGVEIDQGKIPAGEVFGTISNEQGEMVAKSALVIRRNGALYAWALADMGNFRVRLPTGNYEINATAKDHAPGKPREIEVIEDSVTEINLSDIRAPGTVIFSVVQQSSQVPLDAMISITEGNKPIIKHFGRSRFFTELQQPGLAQISIAPGEYRFEISAAAGFTSQTVSKVVSVAAGTDTSVKTDIEIIAAPAELRWYSADLHHHSDVLDGFTEPEYVLRSQLSAGVDIAFLSDHDSVVNNAEMTRLAAARGITFIGGTELSASWAHFNAYPLDVEKTVNPDVGLLSVQGIFAEARRLGAEVIAVNHPFGNYGYFSSLAKETEGAAESGSLVPGGYDLGFDLIEITREHVPETLQRAWMLWNSGKPAYFSAGSDVHDVWAVEPKDASGSARSYVHVPGELTVESYVRALKAGHSYASQGPIIYPQIMFGTELQHPAGRDLELRYQVQAVAGLNSVMLIEKGAETQSRAFAGEERQLTGLQEISFTVRPDADTWFSLVVADDAGNYAYSNPLWVVTAQKNPD